MVDSSVRAMFEALKCSHFSYWQSYIAYVQNKLQDLTSIVVDESVIHHDINGNFNHIHSFKSFLKCHLKGEQQDYSLICGQWIRLNFENFANVWLQIIDDTIKRFDLIHDQLKQSLQTEPALINYISGQKWKFSFTVSELGCFFFVLKESGTLLIPNGLFSDFIRWSAVNFQSLNRSDIQPGSLRNKVIVPDLKAVDSLVFKLKEMLSILYEYQERMTK